MHSQYNEERIIGDFFEKHQPTYKHLVDVGAYGIQYSNTADLLLSKNWKGLLVEPTPESAERLRQEYKNYPNVTISECAVSNYIGKSSFKYCQIGDGCNSLLQTKHILANPKEIEVSVTRLPVLLMANAVPYDFDFLSVDAECEDFKILSDLFNNSVFRPSLLVFEQQDEAQLPRPDFFEFFGYTFYDRTEVNMFYVKSI